MIQIENKYKNLYRKCAKCHGFKQLSDFHKESDRPLGLNSWCKDCYVEYKHNYYVENKGKIVVYIRKYQKEHKEELRKAARERHAVLHPPKPRWNFWTAFSCEICNGTFERRNCEIKYKKKIGQRVRFCSKVCQGTYLGRNFGR